MNSKLPCFSNRFLSQCFQADASFIKRKLAKLKRQTNKDDKQLSKLQELEQLAIQAKEKTEKRLSNRPEIIFPENLPISQKREVIAEAISKHQVVIIAGETGSGKTTQLPKICLELGLGCRGYIGHTQPRRLAARSVASRVAQELASPLGEVVGFKVRFADAIKPESYIKLMTDGILLAELTSDKFLNQYDCLIIDEAHERSLNIDFILGYLKQILPRRPDLKVIITSATIDLERFAKHFDNAPIIEVSGRTFPVETRYRPLLNENVTMDISEGIFSAVEELIAEGPGDILIFLNGEREIRDLADQLNKKNYPHTEILPLFARLSYGEQSKVFSSHTGRRIVLSTNVAETSLTVPGIRYVIDPGTARISRYSYRTKVQRLPIEAISQASANQRQGRCGRVGPGICIRLYEQQDFENRPAFTDPEILRTNLASVILQMLAIGLGEIADFSFIQPPEERHIKDGVLLLEELEAVEKNQGKLRLTQLGRQLSQLPLDPRLARMVIAANEFGCLHQVLVITAGLSIQDPRERPLDKQQAADEAHRRFVDKDSDFVTWLNLWEQLQQHKTALSVNQFRKKCQHEYLSYLRIREWQDLYSQLRQVVHDCHWKLNTTPPDYDRLHQAILTGLLSHVGLKQENNEYLGARNRKFFVFPGSPLAKKGPKWLVATELTETSRLFARNCAKIKPEWLEVLAKHLIKKNYNEPHFEAKQGSVVALENQLLLGLPLVTGRRVQFGPIDPQQARDIFIRSALAEGQLRTKETFFHHNRQLIEDVEELEHKSRRRDILVDEQVLVDFYQQKIPDNIYSNSTFMRWWRKAKQKQPEQLNFDPELLMQRTGEHVTTNDFPNYWIKGSFKFPISYHFEPNDIDDGVSVHIPVALINQIDEKDFDWQVLGLRQEKCVALIKSLPKNLRRNFVPAPDFARACLEAMQPYETSLLESFSRHLWRMTGTKVTVDDFDIATLTDHLLVNFKIEDDKGKLVAQGRNLKVLSENLQGVVADSIRQVAQLGIERQSLTKWDFDDLPREFQQTKSQYEIKAFPALVDNNSSVDIKLFENEFQAQTAHQQGIRRLLLLNMPSPISYLQQKLPNKAKLAMYFNPFGQVQVLISDIIDAAVEKLLEQGNYDIRSKAAFEKACEDIRANLNHVAADIANIVEQILTLYNGIRKRLKGKIPLNIAFAMTDIQAQLTSLVFKGFVVQTGWQRLPDLVRYLQAVDKRLDKLAIDPTKDRMQMLVVQGLQQELANEQNKLSKTDAIPENLVEAKWMIEELRVSFFAQTLGTRCPVSEKRVRQMLHAS